MKGNLGIFYLSIARAKQLKQKTIIAYNDLKPVLLQSDSEIGRGEYEDVLEQYLGPASESIVNNNYLLIKEAGDKLKGAEVYDKQKAVLEKIEEFKGKKINGVGIRKIPSVMYELDAIETMIVEDSRMLAEILLNELDCNSLNGDAKKECNLGWSYYNEASSKTKKAEQIDFYKKAWERGVKALDKLGISEGVASR